MTSKKHTGSYYTPEFLSRFIMRYVATHFDGASYLSVLEPSVGDGIFACSYNERHSRHQ